MFQTLSIYAAKVLHLSRAEVGTLYTLNGILVVLLQLPAVRAIVRLGTRRALMVGAVGYAASYAAVGLATRARACSCFVSPVLRWRRSSARPRSRRPSPRWRRAIASGPTRVCSASVRWSANRADPSSAQRSWTSFRRAARGSCWPCSGWGPRFGYRRLAGPRRARTSRFSPHPRRDVSSRPFRRRSRKALHRRRNEPHRTGSPPGPRENQAARVLPADAGDPARRGGLRQGLLAGQDRRLSAPLHRAGGGRGRRGGGHQARGLHHHLLPRPRAGLRQGHVGPGHPGRALRQGDRLLEGARRLDALLRRQEQLPGRLRHRGRPPAAGDRGGLRLEVPGRRPGHASASSATEP